MSAAAQSKPPQPCACHAPRPRCKPTDALPHTLNPSPCGPMHSPHSQRLLGSSAARLPARCRARRALSTLEYPRGPSHPLVRATAQRTRSVSDVQIRQRSMTRTGLTQLPKYSPASSTLSTHVVPRLPVEYLEYPCSTSIALHGSSSAVPLTYPTRLFARSRTHALTHACLRTRAHTQMHRTNAHTHQRRRARYTIAVQ